MNAAEGQRILRAVDEAEAIARSGFGRSDELRIMAEAKARAHAIVCLLGRAGERWATAIGWDKGQSTDILDHLIGTLMGIRAAVEGGLLGSMESRVLAEAEGDLLEQAQELINKSYSPIAAGVLCRAVLESHLRNWCQREQCSPAKPKPTLDDFKAALYAKQVITNAEQKHVEAMAAIGNLAAHAKPELKQEQVEWLIQNVTAFLANHPLP